MYVFNISGRVPSINSMYVRFMKNGVVRTVLSKDGKKFKNGFKDAILENDFEVLSGDVKVDIDLVFPDHKKRDIDNYSKSLLDCLSGTVIVDDSQIVELNIKKRVEKNIFSAVLRINLV